MGPLGTSSVTVTEADSVGASVGASAGAAEVSETSIDSSSGTRVFSSWARPLSLFTGLVEFVGDIERP